MSNRNYVKKRVSEEQKFTSSKKRGLLVTSDAVTLASM